MAPITTPPPRKHPPIDRTARTALDQLLLNPTDPCAALRVFAVLCFAADLIARRYTDPNDKEFGARLDLTELRSWQATREHLRDMVRFAAPDAAALLPPDVHLKRLLPRG